MRTRATLAAAITLAAAPMIATAGPLTPPAGPVASTHKTLTEVEPRIPISAATTPGDADSVFRIAQPGAYYLTGNVAAPPGKSGIEIAAGGVTLDLCGFALIGTGGGASGVRVTGSSTAITVRNGSATNWSTRGFDLTGGSAVTAENLAAYSNSGIGIACGHGAIVSRCIARANFTAGISVGIGSSVSSCVAALNNGDGFVAGDASSIVNCTGNDNEGDGIVCGTHSVVTACSASRNGADGIQASTSCTISNNTCSENIQDGIEVMFRCLVTGNTCSQAGGGGTGAGIRAVSIDNRIEGNNCLASPRGIDVDGAGNIIVRNTCSGNSVNYEIAAGNRFGPIVDITAAGTPAVSGNAAASTLTSTDANANYAY